MQVQTDESKINDLLTRGVDELIDGEKLRARLLSGEKLRIKLGIDPTSPNLHLGRSVTLLKLRDFQELGHRVVFIVGDFTGVIGDTSDKEAERPMLSHETIEENKKPYLQQVGKLIDLDQAEFRYNSEWLAKLGFAEIGEQADQFSVAEFIARDNIRRRLDAGTRVSLREVLYPLMQGYDSVAIKADVELGGVDQRFNLLAGRTLQAHYQQRPQHLVVTTFPIEGLDGRKMSSSWGNTINFNDESGDMYGKIMSMRDESVEKYFTVLTRVPLAEIETIVAGHPKEAKMRLAREIVTMYHGRDAASKAEENFEKAFSGGGVPDDVQEIEVGGGEKVSDKLVEAKIVSSKTELRRLQDAGAISEVGGGSIPNVDAIEKRPIVLRIGKHRFVKIR